jgi:hypothetical protein
MKNYCYGLFAIVGLALLSTGCEPIKKEPEIANNSVSDRNLPSTAPIGANKTPKPELSPSEILNRTKQFDEMQESMHAVAGLQTSKKGPDYDFKFILPSADWKNEVHAGGDRKSSVWLFSSIRTGLKILLSCAGTKEDPAFAKSAQAVYDSSAKKHAELAREWKVGNFLLRRSFIGFIDERLGETTITAFAPTCTLEFNIASSSLDRDELIKFADAEIENFITKNPTGGFPTK